MWEIDDIASRVTACLILHNILVSDHVMEDVNSTYDPFFSLDKNEEIMIPQSNEFEHQHNKYAHPESPNGEHPDIVIKMVQDCWIRLCNDKEHFRLRSSLMKNV